MFRNLSYNSSEDLVLDDDLTDLLPSIEEANVISQELDMMMDFETVITTPSSRGELKGRKAVRVRKDFRFQTQMSLICHQEIVYGECLGNVYKSVVFRK